MDINIRAYIEREMIMPKKPDFKTTAQLMVKALESLKKQNPGRDFSVLDEIKNRSK